MPDVLVVASSEQCEPLSADILAVVVVVVVVGGGTALVRRRW